MAIPALTDAEIKAEEPLDEDLMKQGLRDRDVSNWSTNGNGGSGIQANVLAFLDTAFGSPGHSHNGDPGEGEPIDTAGIANGAASQEQMFQDDCVSAPKIDQNTLQGSDFAAMSVTTDKMSGTMGYHLTGTVDYDTEADPEAGDVNFKGDRHTVNNSTGAGGKGEPGVICGQKLTSSIATGDRVKYEIIKQEGTSIILGFHYLALSDSTAGTWEYDFRVV